MCVSQAFSSVPQATTRRQVIAVGIILNYRTTSVFDAPLAYSRAIPVSWAHP